MALPLLPIFGKIVESSLAKAAAKTAVGSKIGLSFGERYLDDFGKGVKYALQFKGSGMRDGRNMVAGFKKGVKRLFLDIPKEVAKQKWGEHLAGALVKVTGSRLAAAGKGLAPYGGNAGTYAQSMTALSDKAFRLGFGEANWIPQMMKYTMGEYDPFGTGENGFKTKEENFEWFKDRYNGRKDLTDEARTVGGILGLTPDVIKLILDGNRVLLERESYLTEEQIRANNEYALESGKTHAKWQELSEIWGSNMVGFQTWWQKFSGGIAGTLVDLFKGKKSEGDIRKDYEERAKGIYESVGRGERGLEKDDAENWESLAYHISKGSGRNATDEELAAIAKAQADAGVGDVVTNMARLRIARNDPEKAHAVNPKFVLLDSELDEAAAVYQGTGVATKEQKEKREAEKRKRLKEQEEAEYENDLKNPLYMEGVWGDFGLRLTPDRERLRKNLEKYGASQRVREHFETANWWTLGMHMDDGLTYNPNLKAENRRFNKMMDVDHTQGLVVPHLKSAKELGLSPKDLGIGTSVPVIPPTGVRGDAGTTYYAGDIIIDYKPTFSLVGDNKDAVDAVKADFRNVTERAQEMGDKPGPWASNANILPATYNGSSNP